MARRKELEKEELPKGKFNKQGIGQFAQIFRYILPYKWTFVFGMIFMFLSTVTSLCFPYLIGNLVDTAEQTSQLDFLNGLFSVDKLGIREVLIALVVALILQGFFSFMRIICLTSVSEYAMADIRKHLFSKMISLPLPFFEKNRVGELTSRITADVTQLQDTMSWTLAEMIKQIITMILGVGFIFTISPRLSWVMLSTFPLLIIAAVFFGRFIKRLARKTQDALAEANVVAEETLHNVQVVKSFTNEKLESSRYDTNIVKLVKYALRAIYFRGGFFTFTIYAIFGGIVLVLWQGMKMVQAQDMTIGALVSFVLFTFYIGVSVGGFGDMFSRLLKAIGSSERLLEIFGMESEVNVDASQVVGPKLRGDIEYRNVDFAYPTRDDLAVLKDLNISIPEGKRIALVGSSGAGKSTIVQLLMRFYELNEGLISIGGTDIKDINISHLRQNIGIVPQEVMLFGGTIAENIRYGKPNASDAEVREAAQQANAMEFINSFPDNMETIVGERGIKLSGGQRQRIAIARAILKNPSILVLDEATSSLDSESEMLVQQALNKLMIGRTSIVIAHRLSTIRDVDNIIVLDQGQVVEQGTHQVLSNIPNSMYANFLELQTEWGEV